MSLILPASSSPDLKAFLLLKKSFKSSEGGQRRDSVICSVPHSLLSTNPTDSPDSRFSVGALAVLSYSLYPWRKDPYLPYECQCVRHLPRTNVLACSMFVPAFRHCFAAPKVSPDHPSGKRNSRFCVCDYLTVISRRKECYVDYKLSKKRHLAAIASGCFYCASNVL